MASSSSPHDSAVHDPNRLDPAIWSRNTHRESGEITVAGRSAPSLAAEFGTPLYVIDEADARTRAAETLAAFQSNAARIGTTAKVYYAGKALLTTEIARWMHSEGLHVDVCSGGELAVALAAGVPAERLGFHGNNKSVAEIERAVTVGVGVIVLDSAIEIERVADAAARAGRTQSVRLRVNSGVHAHTHEFLATAHEDQKFGMPLEQVAELVAVIRGHAELDFLGLHCHIGSQIFGSEGFAESAARLLTVQRELLIDGPVPELNLGGGFGIAYVDGDVPTPIAELAAALADIVQSECERLGIPVPVIAVEPGRSIIGPSGLTLYTVGTTKSITLGENAPEYPLCPTRLYVSVDGGMSDNARPALYGADYTARIASRESAAASTLARVAGMHCESGDIVVNSEHLPADVSPGDLLAVAATGAYCWALSSNYNWVGRPPIVAVLDGQARVLVRRESEADLLARDTGAPASTTTSSASVSHAINEGTTR